MCRLRTGTIYSIVPYRLDNNASFMAQPMINVLNFDMSLDGPTTGDVNSPGTQFRFIDLAKELSKVNRKLYRQCRRYAIAGIQVIAEEGSSVSFHTAPDNWITKNSIKKAFHNWQKMNKLVLDTNPSMKATWHDFKVYLNAEHRSNAIQQLRAIPDFDYGPYPEGEWVYSKLVFAGATDSSDGTEMNMHILGDHYTTVGHGAFNLNSGTSVGLIEAYRESRSVPNMNQPNTPGPQLNPWAALHDMGEVSADLSDNVAHDGDNAPYYHLNYSGGVVNPEPYNAAEIRIQSSEVVNMTNGFVAPCGLLKVSTNQEGGIMRLKIFLVPADNAYGIATEAII